MRSRTLLKPHQLEAIEESVTHPQQMLWHDMGGMKTASALTITHDRMDRLEVYGTLVIAPLRVVQLVWENEAKKWDYLQHLTFSLITGTPDRRYRMMKKRADIYLLNYELIEWFVDELIRNYLSRGKYLPFNQIIYDEISKLKDTSTNRHGAIRKITSYAPYRMGLTGTPASNGYKDLFGQYMVVDQGRRLGVDMAAFEEEFFHADKERAYTMNLNRGADSLIKERITDITLQYAPVRNPDELPVINDIMIQLDPKTQSMYDKLERDMFIELDNGDALEVFNAAALSMKVRQISQGAAFIEPENPEWAFIHNLKLKALDEVIEEAAGEPVLIAYQFQHDRERIMKQYPDAVYFGGHLNQQQAKKLMVDWQEGRISKLICHPQSVGYGTDGLQYGGHILVWFGITWSLDDYEQTIRRLDRTGQERRVTAHRILALNTIDMLMTERVAMKAVTQDELKATINNYRQMRGM